MSEETTVLDPTDTGSPTNLEPVPEPPPPPPAVLINKEFASMLASASGFSFTITGGFSGSFVSELIGRYDQQMSKGGKGRIMDVCLAFRQNGDGAEATRTSQEVQRLNNSIADANAMADSAREEYQKAVTSGDTQKATRLRSTFDDHRRRAESDRQLCADLAASATHSMRSARVNLRTRITQEVANIRGEAEAEFGAKLAELCEANREAAQELMVLDSLKRFDIALLLQGAEIDQEYLKAAGLQD